MRIVVESDVPAQAALPSRNRFRSVQPRGNRALAWFAALVCCFAAIDSAAAADKPGRLSINAGGGSEARVVEISEDGQDNNASPRPADTTKPADVARNLSPVPISARQPLGEAPVIDAEALTFKGVQPGHTTREELHTAWGVPLEIKKSETGSRETFRVEPFERVAVTIEGQRVVGVIVSLERSIAAKDLARELHIDQVTSVTVPDDQGHPLGEAFPEHGVLFAYAPNEAPRVQQLVLETIDPQAFLLRAEVHLRDRPASSLIDADYALQIEPQRARGYTLRSQALAALGKYSDALQAANDAMRLEPATADFQLLAARIMIEEGDYDKAAEMMDKLIAGPPLSPLSEARARCIWGDGLIMAAKGDRAPALEQHQQAIKLAEPLAADPRLAIRRVAKEILVDAHLGAACDIARGRWQQKDQVVPKWLARAKAFAADMVAHEQADEEILQRVHETAMLVLSLVPDGPPATQWIEATRRLGNKQIAAAVEPARRQALEWRLGLALSDASAMEQFQHHPEQAIELGEAAVELLERSYSIAEQLPGRDYLVGRAYYRLGATEAMERRDHKLAVVWYGKSIPYMQSPVATSAAMDVGRQGDTLVSMAVSYWETGAHAEALRLTKEGARLIEQAVAEGLTHGENLAVPYGNLATMLGEMGEKDEAHRFAQMAARFEAGKKH